MSGRRSLSTPDVGAGDRLRSGWHPGGHRRRRRRREGLGSRRAGGATGPARQPGCRLRAALRARRRALLGEQRRIGAPVGRAAGRDPDGLAKGPQGCGLRPGRRVRGPRARGDGERGPHDPALRSRPLHGHPRGRALPAGGRADLRRDADVGRVRRPRRPAGGRRQRWGGPRPGGAPGRDAGPLAPWGGAARRPLLSPVDPPGGLGRIQPRRGFHRHGWLGLPRSRPARGHVRAADAAGHPTAVRGGLHPRRRAGGGRRRRGVPVEGGWLPERRRV